MIGQLMIGATLLASAATASAQVQDGRYAAPPPPAYAQGYAAGYAAAHADGQPVASVDVFFEPLSRYGDWIETRWGRAFAPRVPQGWRPYTVGRWEDSPEYGRTWRSDEPFGWATYHYGRWGFDERYGWVWVPDTVWGPGWVAWRDGGDYAGWAPLPPQVDVGYGAGGGYGYVGGGGYAGDGPGIAYEQWYAPSWVYVPRSYVYGRSVVNVILPVGRNREGWERTRDVTHYERDGGRIVNRSFDEHRWDARRVEDRRVEDRRGDGRRADADRRGADPRAAVIAPVVGDSRAAHWGDDRRGDDRRGDERRGGDRPGAMQAFTGRPAINAAPPVGAVPVAAGARPAWERRRNEVFQPATIDNAPPPANAVVRPRQNIDAAAGYNRPQRAFAPPPAAAMPSGGLAAPIPRAPAFAPPPQATMRTPAFVAPAPRPAPAPLFVAPAPRPAPTPPAQPRPAPAQRSEPHPDR